MSTSPTGSSASAACSRAWTRARAPSMRCSTRRGTTCPNRCARRRRSPSPPTWTSSRSEGRLPEGVERPGPGGAQRVGAAQHVPASPPHRAARRARAAWTSEPSRRRRASSMAAASGVSPVSSERSKIIAGGRADAADTLARGSRVIAAGLLGDVDDAAGVGDEVRRPQDVVPLQEPGDSVVGELVVGRTRDCPAAQPRYHLVVEQAAQGARREHVDLGAPRLGGGRPAGAELLRERLLARIDVGDDEPGSGAGASLGHPRADMAEAEHAHAAVAQRAVAEGALAGGADGRLDAERGERAGVTRAAAAAGQAGDVSASAARSRPCLGSRCPTSSAVM